MKSANRDYCPNCQRQSIEILPQLREKWSRYLWPKIASVQIVQSQDRCHLEVTTINAFGADLVDELRKRTDLSFIVGGCAEDGKFFSPTRSVIENARRFVSDFDVVDVIQCTELFTPEACVRLDAHWQQYGVVSDEV